MQIFKHKLFYQYYYLSHSLALCENIFDCQLIFLTWTGFFDYKLEHGLKQNESNSTKDDYIYAVIQDL